MKAKAPNPDPAALAARFVPVLFAVALSACAGPGAGDAGFDPAVDPRFDRPEWRACTGDAHCTTSFLSCHGWEAVRADREAEVRAWYERTHADMLSRSDCAGADDMPRPAAICRADRCEAVVPERRATADDRPPPSAPTGTP